MFESLKNWLTVRLLRKPVPGFYDEVDGRNFGAHAVAGSVSRDDLVEHDFHTFLPPRLIDQKSSDFCVGCSKAYAKAATEGVDMSWPGAYAMGCRALGYIPDFGISILQVMKGAVKFGVPELSLWPYTGKKYHDAQWENMSKEVLDNALKHRDGSFFVMSVDPGWDKFDVFRAYLWKLRDRSIAVQTGADAHAITLVGQKRINGVLHLFGPDSYGTDRKMNYRLGFVKDGYRYFTRAEVNQMFTGYFALDMERELAELLNEYDGKAVKEENSAECFLVKNGEKHWLKNEAIAWSHNTLLFGEDYVHVLSEPEFARIPTGSPAKFDEGPNRDIILRILEKTGKTDLIDEA